MNLNGYLLSLEVHTVVDPTCIELFAGTGGASLGLHRAGYQSLLAAEWDPNACATHRVMHDSPVFEGDVRKLDAEITFDKPPHLMWASPPCQPFSSAGKRLGSLDDRNGWPWTLDILDRMQKRGCRPTWVICENVPGLTHHKSNCPRDPDMDPFDCPGCYWERWIIPEFEKRFAHVSVRMIDAANFGVPQRRKRIFLVAGPEPYKWPKPSHSFHNLVHDKWVTGAYWKQHGLVAPAKGPSVVERKLLESIQMQMGGPEEGVKPWFTVRDALGLGAAIRTEAVGVDDAAPTVSGGGNMYTAPKAGEVRTADFGILLEHPDTKFTSQITPDPKHPEKSIDEPSTGIRGGGDGNDAPHYWLKQGTPRVIGGGTNPHKPGRADERTHRDITDEPCTTIAASSGGGAGNAGPWVEGEIEPSRPITDPDTLHDEDPGKRSQESTCVRLLERSSGSRGLEETDMDAVAPTVLGGDGLRGWDRLQVERVVSVEKADDTRDFFDFLEAEDESKREVKMVGAYAAHHDHQPGDLPELLDTPFRTVSATEVKGASSLGKLNRASDDLFLATGRRRLTVDECAALQGFPMDYNFQGTKTSQYKQVGNAVCPQVSEALARAVLR